ncbi:MAG: cytochrome c [Gammaproteobacteria bacterium]|nr:cytochrome c [Gammaproteobacteria bacterium]
MRTSITLSAAFLALAAATGHAQPAGMSQGEYVARLGNCVACHSIPGGAPFAGGLKMAVPRLGAIYTTNITPDKDTGIGSYTFEDFDRAMRAGVTPDGKYLYPAMPYPSYAKLSEQDMRALYDYFMKEVAPVKQQNKPAEITGWKAIRWPLAIWNFLFVDDEPYATQAGKDASWNRGAYLVQGAGHCGACHTPRGLFMQEKSLDESSDAFMAGAELDHWSARSLNGDMNSGLGRWTEQDVVDLLKTGRNAHGVTSGTMVEVVNNSTQYMTDEDLKAVAVYLKSLPAALEKSAPAYAYDQATADKLRQFDLTQPGAATFSTYCSGCHTVDGKGYPPHQPPLAGNGAVLDPRASSLVNLVLNGSQRVVTAGNPASYDMPFFRTVLSDQEIADVVSFVRSGWGNNASGVTAAEVAAIRAATDPLLHDIIVLRMK